MYYSGKNPLSPIERGGGDVHTAKTARGADVTEGILALSRRQELAALTSSARAHGAERT